MRKWTSNWYLEKVQHQSLTWWLVTYRVPTAIGKTGYLGIFYSRSGKGISYKQHGGKACNFGFHAFQNSLSEISACVHVRSSELC